MKVIYCRYQYFGWNKEECKPEVMWTKWFRMDSNIGSEEAAKERIKELLKTQKRDKYKHEYEIREE